MRLGCIESYDRLMGSRPVSPATVAAVFVAVVVASAVGFLPRASGADSDGLIVFARDQGPVGNDRVSIWMARPDGSMFKKVRLTECCSLNPSPEWSPGGRKLAVVDEMGVRLIDGDGVHHLQRVCRAPDCSGVVGWSPDGRRLATFDPNDFVTGILDLKTRKVRALRNTAKFLPDSLEWSPDGKTIALTNGHLWLMRPDGTDQKWLHLKFLVHSARWSPDGKMLLLADVGIIYTLPSGGGAPMPIVRSPTSAQGMFDAAWSPNGRQIAYSTYGPIYVRDLATGHTRRLDASNHLCSGPDVSCYGIDWSR